MSTQPEPLSEQRLAEIEQRHAAATPGPWPLGEYSFERYHGGTQRIVTVGRIVEFEADRPEASSADFISHSIEDVPALVAEVRRLKAALSDAAQVAHAEGAYTAAAALRRAVAVATRTGEQR